MSCEVSSLVDCTHQELNSDLILKPLSFFCFLVCPVEILHVFKDPRRSVLLLIGNTLCCSHVILFTLPSSIVLVTWQTQRPTQCFIFIIPLVFCSYIRRLPQKVMI